MIGSFPAPCGKCIPCLINRKRLWTHRIILESYKHESSSFVTLTYSDENLEFRNEKTKQELLESTLSPTDLKNFIKRLRRSNPQVKLRYYAVGEYGDRSWRPHYHIALFGYEPCWHGGTRIDRLKKGKSCCPPCDKLYAKWGKGGIDNARIENDSAGYIAGYVTKKLTKDTDPRLNGRYPEFSRMSRKPGIGANAIEDLAETIFSKHGKLTFTEYGDVPISLKHGKRQLPLGKYLREKLREAIGSDDLPKEMSLQAYTEEMLLMYKDYLDDPEIPKENKLGFKQFIQQRDAQKIENIEKRSQLNRKVKSL
jgi:hypothetical protein